MKTIILFCVLTLGFFTNSFSQEYGWKDISVNVPGDSLYHDLSDLFFVSDNEGWITSSSHQEIYHTTDGGVTFDIQTTQFPCNAIYMINENEGYSGGENGRVYRTTDGGLNWIAIGSIGETLMDLDFATSTIGYGCGIDGAVYSITPDGVSNLNSGLGNTWYGISAPFIDNIWVGGGSNIYYFNGDSFTEQPSSSGSTTAIYMLTNEVGFVSGHAEGSLVAGCNGIDIAWTNHFDIQQYEESLFDIYALNSNELWTVGVEGAIFHTSNGSEYGFDTITNEGWSNAIWERQGEGLTSNFLRGVFFTSSTNGYIVGNNKTLLKYSEISNVGDYMDGVDFEIFPNPSTNSVQINCSDFNTESGTIELLSIVGKKILDEEINKGTKNIDLYLSDLEPGMYLCKITIDIRSSTKKIIKE